MLALVDDICAENDNTYSPASSNTILLAGVPCVIFELPVGTSYVSLYAVFARAGVTSDVLMKLACPPSITI